MLIRQTFAYLPAQLIGPLSQFATAIILTHWLAKAEYGLTMLIFASQELVFLVGLSWWTFYMMRYSGSLNSEQEQQRYRDTETSVILISTLAQIGLTILIIVLSEPDVSYAFYFGACFFTISRSFLNLLSERSRTLGAIKDYSLVQIGAPVGGLILTIGVMYLIGAKPGWVLLVFAIMQTLVGALVGNRLGLLRKPGRIDPEIFRAALTFGIPVVLSGALGWVAGNGIRFVVQYAKGADDLGLLSVGWGLASRLSTVAALVVTAAAYPLAVKAMEVGDSDGARRQLSDNSALLVGVVAPATFGVIAINEPLVRLLIAPEFQAATIALLPWALAAAAIRNIRMHGWDQLYLLFEAPKQMMVLEGVEAALTVLGATIGVFTYGLTGAVIGTLIAAIVVAIGDFFYLRGCFGLRLPLALLLRVLIATGVMFIAVRLLPSIGLDLKATWMSITLAIGIGMLAYALMVVVMFPSLIGSARDYLRARRAG